MSRNGHRLWHTNGYKNAKSLAVAVALHVCALARALVRTWWSRPARDSPP